jgi:hypothetical protein
VVTRPDSVDTEDPVATEERVMLVKATPVTCDERRLIDPVATESACADVRRPKLRRVRKALIDRTEM